MIKIDKVSKRYEDQIAVDCMSLSIKKGEIYGLLGPNGAGKSTLVNMMCGILNIEQGNITLGGFDIMDKPLMAKKLLGMVPQDLALFENMSVLQNLTYFGELYGLKKKDLSSAIQKALHLSQLEEHKNKKVKKLSGGMKRRLNIACSTLHNPQILILDEPTVGIDPQSRNHIMEVVQKLNTEYQTTVIYITHYMEEVEKLCHRIAIVDQGKLVIEGTKDFIISSLTHENQYRVLVQHITEAHLEKLESTHGISKVNRHESGVDIICKQSLNFTALTKVLDELALAIDSISLIKPDLEWAFLKLTGRALRD